MCVGLPMKVLRVDGLAAVCDAGGRVETVDLSLVGPQAPGQWLLVHLGAAREALDAETAGQIARALDGLRAAIEGRALGDAFADLEARAPSLPPHLEAARRAGRGVA
jgi:hydrogenase expression/formation protein HypC